MSWKKEVDELKKREKLAEEMGGAKKLKKQKENNRLNIRERIEKLLDNTFSKIKNNYKDKKYLVALSAGVDSRLIVSLMKELEMDLL